jgi:hypothetical protein
MAEVVQHRARNSWIRLSTIAGYVLLMLAIKMTGGMAGYSNETTVHLIDHILARSLVLTLGSAFVWGLVGKSMLARWSRWDMDKSHLGMFALAALLGGVGMVVMAQRGSPDVQDDCFDGLAILIGWSMGLEYSYVANRRLAT